MCEELIIKYKVVYGRAIEPRKATLDSTGYDIFTAEDKILESDL